MNLRDRHIAILAYLRERAAQGLPPPSRREIGDATGISSTSMVSVYLRDLDDWEYISLHRGCSRAIVLLDRGDSPAGSDRLVELEAENRRLLTSLRVNKVQIAALTQENRILRRRLARIRTAVMSDGKAPREALPVD